MVILPVTAHMPLTGKYKTTETFHPAMSKPDYRYNNRSIVAVLKEQQSSNYCLQRIETGKITQKMVTQNYNRDTSRDINFNPAPVIALNSIP